MSTVAGIMFGLFVGYQFGTPKPHGLSFVGIIVSFIFVTIAVLRSEFLLNADKIIVPEEKQKELSKKLSPHTRHKTNDENE